MKISLFTTTLVALGSSLAMAAERPNVVFILTDDQRGDAVGYHPTPLLGITTLKMQIGNLGFGGWGILLGAYYMGVLHSRPHI